MNRVLSFTDAIKEATDQAMGLTPTVHMLGLGVTYPNGADGTTGGLAEKFPGRVHDIPCSENAITGMAVGMAVSGLRPIVHHGRIEFAFYAADALLTQAANWNYMFGGDYPCPLTVRVALGRQWGNGPQHTRSARSFFAVPGLKVVVPSTPTMAKGLLLSAVRDDNPVIFLEHRWSYKLKQNVSSSPFYADLGRAQTLRSGDDVTIIAIGDMVLEALRAAKVLKDQYDINADVIDLVSLYPMDLETIISSVDRTMRLLVVDAATPAFSVAHEVIANIVLHSSNFGSNTGGGLGMLTCPDVPCPTATSLTADYYPTDRHIVQTVTEMFETDYIPQAPHSFEDLNLAPAVHVGDLLKEEVTA